MRTALLIVGHGSREVAANREFQALVGRYRAARPSLVVAHAYLELADPPLSIALQQLARRADHVVVLPLFLFAAGHVKNDLSLAIHQARRDFPAVRFAATRALGVHPILVDLALARAQSVVECLPRQTALVVVGRGSSDPDANGDFCKLVRLVGEGGEFAWVVPSFIGITRPLFQEAFELVARSHPECIVVVPYFLFAGRLIGKLQGQVEDFRRRYPWIRVERSAHLGPSELLFDLIDERLGDVLGGERPLPCDNCRYRLPVSGVFDDVRQGDEERWARE